MPGGVAEVERDIYPLVQGIHKGATGVLILNDPADFRSCGVLPGIAVYNVTDGSNGLVVSLTESTVLCTLAGGTNNYWSYDDVYKIYKTSAYNSVISTDYVDRRYGHKVVNPAELVDGIKADELDVDEYERNIFSPDQPSKSKKGW